MDLRNLRRPIHLVLDWDGTLTRKDTLSIVGQIGYWHHRRDLEGKSLGSSGLEAPSLKPWNYFVKAYGEDYIAHQAEYRPKAEERRTVREERTWLASLAPIENRSVRRVEDSGLFHGVTTEDVDKVARKALAESQLELRKGWYELFGKLSQDRNSDAARSGNIISILSVNWSERFIRRAMLAAADSVKHTGTADQQQPTSLIQDMDIRANEIEGLDQAGGSEGKLNKKDSHGIRTSADKLAQMPADCRSNVEANPQERPSSGDHSVVYVGDSATDFECLLAADVGICIRDEPMGSGQKELANSLKRVGIPVLHVNENPPQDGRKVVWWAKDFGEIATCLCGYG